MPFNVKSKRNLGEGTPPKWNHTPTVPVRYPRDFIPQLTEIARRLDNGEAIAVETPVTQTAIYQELDAANKEKKRLRLELEKLRRAPTEAKGLTGIKFDGIHSNIGAVSELMNSLPPSAHPIFAEEWRARADYTLQSCWKVLGELDKALEKETRTDLICEWLKDLDLFSLIQIQAAAEREVEKHKKEEISQRIELLGDQIVVYRGEYDAEFVAWCKKHKGQYRSHDKGWRFGMGMAEIISLQFPDYSRSPEVDAAIEVAITKRELAEKKQRAEEENRQKQAELIAAETIELVKVADINREFSFGKLFYHQKQAVEWLLAHRSGSIHRGGILADHMGLGKTLSALVAAKAIADIYHCPIFVICPASLKENWRREAAKVECSIEVFSWAKMPKPLETKFLLIADEAHYSQNLKSARSKNLIGLAESENCIGTWLLTGTPMKNGKPVNLFPLLKAIAHPLATNQKEYEKHYCAAGYVEVRDRWIWDTTGSAYLDELATKTEDCILRRTKKDCLDLPEKVRLLRPVELEAKKAKEYKAKIKTEIEDYRTRVEAGLVDAGAEALVKINVLRKVGSFYKMPATTELAEEVLEQDESVVIFTEFLNTADYLHLALSRYGAVKLTRETHQKERQLLVDQFQNGNAKVFIATTKAGGVGLTLTAASHVILSDRPWTPGDAEQAEDRCHRIGQESCVHSIWPQLGVIDEAIDNLLEAKQKRIELVLRGKKKTLDVASPKELAKQLMEVL